MEGDLLGKQNPHGETKKIDFFQTQGIDEGFGIFCDGADGIGCFAARGGYSFIIEYDHFAIPGEEIEDFWVPVFHGAGEVL